MVEKIIVSRDETIHFPWLDRTWVYIYHENNKLTSNKMFKRLLVALFKYGIKETTGKTFDGILSEAGYLFIKHDSDEIINILKNACQHILTCGLVIKDPTSELGKFFEEHKAAYLTVIEETKKILDEKKYTYYFQRVDGMN